MPKYIIEARDGNPAICELQDNGTYKKIAFGAGEKTVPELLALITLANAQLSQ